MIKFIISLLKRMLVKHPFNTSALVHRKNNDGIIYEVEFNWFDENLDPITVVREMQTGKVFSIGKGESYDFKEYSGHDPSAGSTI